MATRTQAFLTAVRSNLESTLPGLLAAEGLPPVVEFTPYWPEPVPAKAPQVWAVCLASARDNSMTHGATINKYSIRWQIGVGINLAANDESTVTTWRDAYADLIRQAVESDLQASNHCLWIAWQGNDYSPPFKVGGRLYLEAMLRFEALSRVLYGHE